jgi:hypothetical protein
MGKTAFTDVLVPTSSFLTGVGSVLAVGGDYFLYNRSHSPSEADRRALRNDVAVVASDFAVVMEFVPPEKIVSAAK